MERPLCSVYRCLTCKLKLDDEDASKEHERKTGHTVKRTTIIIVPPKISANGGFNIKCIMAGRPSAGAQQGGDRTSRPPPQSNMLVMTKSGQIVQRQVQAVVSPQQLIPAPSHVASRIGGGRPVFFIASESGPREQSGSGPRELSGSGPRELSGLGPRELPERVPIAIDEQTVETTVEGNQGGEEAGEREQGAQQQETVGRQQVNEVPLVPGISNANLALLSEAQRAIIRNPSLVRREGGGKVVDTKRVLGQVRSNPFGNNKGGRRNFS